MSRVQELEQQIYALKQELAQARADRAPEPVRDDFPLITSAGHTTLSDLFGDRSDLIVIHNMGGACNYCTLWADGYSGYLRHLTEKAAFVVVSPDSPENQAKLAGARGWSFTMAQDATREFTTAMGFWKEEEGWWPGCSVFHKDADGNVTRTGTTHFGPGDDFCMVWPLFEMITGGAGDWEPR